MLRNRSRTVTSKQSLMADQSSVSSSPSQSQTRPTSSIFGPPRFFNGFIIPKGPSEIETMSPTSILDTKPFSSLTKQPFGYDSKKPSKSPNIFSATKHPWENEDPKGIGIGIGLALVDSLHEKTQNDSSKPNNNKVLFGSKLKIQIPPIPPSPFSPTQSPKSPGDYGIKTRNSHFSNSPSPFGNSNSNTQTKGNYSPRVIDLSVTEMELSEEYTRVISHGPSPRTTHIFVDCVLESCDGVVGLSELKRELSSSPIKQTNPPLESFLSFCYTCKKKLEQGKDIYMYGGEKGFCSIECRSKEMLSDGVDNPEIK